MIYNTCKICGAKDGRAGLLVNSPDAGIEEACLNCWDSLKENKIVMHSHLTRTDEEIDKMFNALTIYNNKETINEVIL